jgi:EPS-associated MarR family transcriptional regulator
MKKKDNIDHLNILRKVHTEPNTSQRKLAEDLGFSLGKLNYCIKELQKKGHIKLKNFQNQNNKIKYLQYIVTPKGIAERAKLTINFMKRKIKEYDELKEELKKF